MRADRNRATIGEDGDDDGQRDAMETPVHHLKVDDGGSQWWLGSCVLLYPVSIAALVFLETPFTIVGAVAPLLHGVLSLRYPVTAARVHARLNRFSWDRYMTPNDALRYGGFSLLFGVAIILGSLLA